MNRVLIIAEAGVNHNGCIEIAKKLIDVASDAGANYVKFQTFKAEAMASKNAPKAKYQKETTGNDSSQFEMIKKLELSFDDHLRLIDYCKKKDIEFLSSAFDLESIDLLNKLGLKTVKVPSGEITNLPYLRKVGSLNKHIVLSTGMADLDEIQDALNILIEAGTDKKQIIVLHCNSEYPTPMKDVNLRAMLTIKETFNVKTGYSDHTLGIEVPIASVAMGASCIEKHITLDRNMEGPDHKASLEPDELKAMVKAIRKIEIALGDGIKKPSKSEQTNIHVARKSIHLARDLNKAHIIREEDLIMKRPGDGISPMKLDLVVGKQLKKNRNIDYKLRFFDFC